MNSKVLTITILVAVAALAASGCSPATATPQPTSVAASAPKSSEVTAEGRLEPVRYATLALNADGSVSDLLAQEGEQVEAGEVIATVHHADAQTLAAAQTSAAKRLADAYQAVRDSQNKLDDYDVQAIFSGMTAEQAARKSLATLNAARAAFQPYKDMSHIGVRPNRYFPSLPRHIYVDTGVYTGEAKEYSKAVDRAWIDYRRAVQWLTLDSALESAQAQLTQAQKDYDSLQDSSLAEDTAGTRAALANAELRAPFAGTLTNLNLKVGEFAASGSPVVTVADFSSWIVKTTDLTEIDVVKVKQGQPVTLTLDAVPGASLQGTVLSVGQNYNEKQGDIVYEVKVLLADTLPEFRWGMTAQLRFGN